MPVFTVKFIYCKFFNDFKGSIKGVVYKITDVVEVFNAHIRTQGVDCPRKYLSFKFSLNFAEIKKFYVCVLNLSQNQS